MNFLSFSLTASIGFRSRLQKGYLASGFIHGSYLSLFGYGWLHATKMQLPRVPSQIRYPIALATHSRHGGGGFQMQIGTFFLGGRFKQIATNYTRIQKKNEHNHAWRRVITWNAPICLMLIGWYQKWLQDWHNSLKFQANEVLTCYHFGI